MCYIIRDQPPLGTDCLTYLFFVAFIRQNSQIVEFNPTQTCVGNPKGTLIDVSSSETLDTACDHHHRGVCGVSATRSATGPRRRTQREYLSVSNRNTLSVPRGQITDDIRKGKSESKGATEMLNDLFNNRLFIGALAFFVLMVVGGTSYIWHVERQEVEKLTETQARIEVLTEKQKPPTAAAPVGDTSQGGHWHGDEWHAQPHDTPAAAGVKNQLNAGAPIIRPLTRPTFNRTVNWEAYEAWYRKKHGIDPPPLDANWRHVWDEDGNVHRLYDGETTILKYETRIGFAPTKAQYERYLQLYEELKSLTSEGPRATEISQELRELFAKSQGEIPVKFSSVHIAHPTLNREAYEEDAKAARMRAIRRLYREFDLEHLIPYYFPGL